MIEQPGCHEDLECPLPRARGSLVLAVADNAVAPSLFEQSLAPGG